MHLTCELKRFSFLCMRDGDVKARQWCVNAIHIYLCAARARRLKHGKADAYAHSYVESAYSFRWILRHVHARNNGCEVKST
jgi:hypothetical protein